MSTIPKGKTALITGSTRGIGEGIARGLARQGVQVMLNGFGDPKKIELLRASLAAESGVAIGYHDADVSRPDEIARLVTDTRKSLARSTFW